MKWVLFIVLFIVVALGAGVAMFPMSIAADYISKQVPDLRFANATGSVWNGGLSQVRLGDQVLGDVTLKTNPMKLFSGQAGGSIGVVRDGFTGAGSISYSLTGGAVELSDIDISGRTSGVPGLPQQIRDADGAFTLRLSDLRLEDDTCVSAVGEVWTDALSRFDFGGDWEGPELRGPVSCTDGGLLMQASGQSLTGESVTAGIAVGGDFGLDLTARVDPASGSAADRLRELGFQPEGSGMVLQRPLSQ